MSLSALTITSKGHICEGLFIPQMFERGHHVRLEVIPSETKLLLVIHSNIQVFL